VIAVTEPQDWPFERPAEGTRRPWYLAATGYLEVLFRDPEEAQRAQRGLLQHQISQEELRLYESEEILRTRDRAGHLVQLLADYDYSSLRYYGDHGVTDVQRDADQHPSHAGRKTA
jgi:hypothetical protein